MERIVLVGAPNAGKTTLFNTLTGKNEKVGNWHGVTVDKKEGEFTLKGEKFTVIDLPGLYTLKGSTAEEKTAREFLQTKNYDKIVVVVEAQRIRKSLTLIKELRELNVPIIVFINLYKDLLKKKGSLDQQKAKEALGVNVIVGEAVDKKTVEKLLEKIERGFSAPSQFSDETDFFTPPKINFTLSKILFGKAFALPCFFVIVLFSLWFSFGRYSPIYYVSELFEIVLNDGLGRIVNKLLQNVVSPFLLGLICEGVIGGVSAVFAFLPQVLALGLCVDFLDQSGYLSCFSAVADDILGKFGLGGRALYTLFGGFGCTAVAVVSVKGIEDRGVRLRTALCLPFISCSAKTPVYLFFASAIFKGNAFGIIVIIWLLSIIISLLNSLLLKNTFIKSKKTNFVAEVADLKLPNSKNILKSLQKTAIQFIIKIASVVLIASSSLWILQNVSTSFTFLNGENVENSLLALIGKPLKYLFYPIGLADWRYGVATLTGVFAKEGIVSTLTLLFKEGINLSLPQAVGLTAFCYAYTPCITALRSISKTVGVKYAVFSAVYGLIAALLLCYGSFFIVNLL